jgi:hypothetical protein
MLRKSNGKSTHRKSFDDLFRGLDFNMENSTNTFGNNHRRKSSTQ